MFSRQPAAGGADLYQDEATTTLRSAFPNSRLDSLAAHPTPANPADPSMDSQLAAPDPTELGGASAGYNPSLDDDWWSNAIEVDTFDSPLAFDASENGLWNGHFVPPPPRPPFLDESVAADGLTTCDLCTWAWQRNAYSLDGSIAHPQQDNTSYRRSASRATPRIAAHRSLISIYQTDVGRAWRDCFSALYFSKAQDFPALGMGLGLLLLLLLLLHLRLQI
ncbi:PREDICTED: uncharacterized protein LOC108614472 isoform X2 [Drosophila arizonae]|uniref:Uncharacterized protein LOC108614472 isoform X2 n=1 Tax=Drosophila arizonae TaxID=7263 RepID=A0ABM1PA70_DROAR|nr:PREDICTED: uncharacterized protein LOC108614472 isoform X2 [Drosophila arizonae]